MVGHRVESPFEVGWMWALIITAHQEHQKDYSRDCDRSFEIHTTHYN